MLGNLVVHAPVASRREHLTECCESPVQVPNIPSHIDQLLRRQNWTVQQFKLFHLALVRVFIRLIGKHPHGIK